MKNLLTFAWLAVFTPAFCLAVDSTTYINRTGLNSYQAPTTAPGTNGQFLQTNGDYTTTWGSGNSGTITGVTAGTGMSGGGTSGTVTLTNAGVVSISSGTGISATAGTGTITLATLISTFGVTAAGTAYQFTASSATLDFGTTDPTLTLTQAGTYLILPRVNVLYNAATFAASRTLTLKVRRTNNTGTDLKTMTAATGVITTLTSTFGVFPLDAFVYTTSNTDDAIAITGFLSVVPTAGSLDATEANILAIRLF